MVKMFSRSGHIEKEEKPSFKDWPFIPLMKFKVHGGGAQISWLNFRTERVHGGGGDSVIEHYSKYTNPQDLIDNGIV